MKIDEKSLSIALSKSSVTDWRRANGPALQCKSLILSHAGPIKINMSVLSISLVRFRYCKWMGSMDTPEISPTLDRQEECIVSIRSHLRKHCDGNLRSLGPYLKKVLALYRTRKKDIWMILKWSFKNIIKTQFISIFTGWPEQMIKTPIAPMIPKCFCWQRVAEDPGEEVSPKGMRPSMGDGGSWYQVHTAVRFKHVPSTLICSEHPPCPPVFPGCHVQRQAGLRRGLLSKELKALSPKQRGKGIC